MDTPNHPETANDRINARIVNGLFVVAILLVVGSVAIFIARATVVNEIVMLVSNITSGLIGYLAREYKQAPGSPSAVNTDSVGTVNVQPAAPAQIAADPDVPPTGEQNP